MIKEFAVTLDIEKAVRNPVYSVNSNDLDSVKILATVNKSGVPVNLTGLTVRIAIKKPDGKSVFQNGTITNAATGKCEFLLTSQAHIVGGAHKAEIMLYQGSTKVSVTGDFTYTVAKGALNGDSKESQTELQAINQAVADVEAVVEDLRVNGTGIDAQARQDLVKVNEDLAIISQQK